MTSRKTFVRRVVLVGALALAAKLAAAQIPSPALLITIGGRGVKGEHALAIADPQTRKVVHSIPLTGSAHPHELAVSDDGKFAFVTNTFYAHEFGETDEPIRDGSISIIDLAKLKEVRRVEIGPDSVPHGIVFAGGKVYFTAEGYQMIGRYDPSSNAIDWMFGTGQIGTHLLAITKDLNKIFSASTISNNVIAIEPWDRRDDRGSHASFFPWMSTVIPVGKGPEGIAISPDQKEVWTLIREEGKISIIDVATKKLLQTVELKMIKEPVRLKFTPDGKRVLTGDSESGEAVVLDAASRKEIQLIGNLGKRLHEWEMAPDGSRAFVSAHYENFVSIIDLKTLQSAGRIYTGEKPESIVWLEKK